MTDDAADLSGCWTGSYAYPGQMEPVPFTVELRDDGGRLSGLCQEDGIGFRRGRLVRDGGEEPQFRSLCSPGCQDVFIGESAGQNNTGGDENSFVGGRSGETTLAAPSTQHWGLTATLPRGI